MWEIFEKLVLPTFKGETASTCQYWLLDLPQQDPTALSAPLTFPRAP